MVSERRPILIYYVTRLAQQYLVWNWVVDKSFLYGVPQESSPLNFVFIGSQFEQKELFTTDYTSGILINKWDDPKGQRDIMSDILVLRAKIITYG